MLYVIDEDLKSITGGKLPGTESDLASALKAICDIGYCRILASTMDSARSQDQPIEILEDISELLHAKQFKGSFMQVHY